MRIPRERIYRLHNFTFVSFRVVPRGKTYQKLREFFPLFKANDPYAFAIIVEIGIATLNKKPVIVVTNAQAARPYYSLPWGVKKVFKGAYERVLEIISKSSGNEPVLIPSNKTVKEYIRELFGHEPPDSVLNEFYDRFSQKRGRRKVAVQVKNSIDGKKINAEFWLTK